MQQVRELGWPVWKQLECVGTCMWACYLHITPHDVQYFGSVVSARFCVCVREWGKTQKVWIKWHRKWAELLSINGCCQDPLFLQTCFVCPEAPKMPHLNDLHTRDPHTHRKNVLKDTDTYYNKSLMELLKNSKALLTYLHYVNTVTQPIFKVTF